jgi:cation diffusion facilitator family transporter
VRTPPPYELPRDKQEKLARARRLEWWTIGFLLSIIVVMYLTMGSSQAMKAAWIEDVLSLIPPIAFLVAQRYRDRPPNERFPYGHRRAVSVAFLASAAALTIFGLYLLYDSVMKLVMMEHPTIGTMRLFGWDVWAGWVMIAALVYSAIPPVILGRMKLPLSEQLHEKALHTDAAMNKADWMTALAGVVGLLGVGIGWWWADAAAAGLISLDVLKDGLGNLKGSISDLMDQKPTTVDRKETDGLPERVRAVVEGLAWVEAADVRLREEGHVVAGEIYVVPRTEADLIDRAAEAARLATSVDWRLYDLVVVPVRTLDGDDGDARAHGRAAPAEPGAG